jgi:hypothetical protein
VDGRRADAVLASLSHATRLAGHGREDTRHTPASARMKSGAAAGPVPARRGGAERFTIQAAPTLMVMKGGQVIAGQAGAAPAPARHAWIEWSLSNLR